MRGSKMHGVCRRICWLASEVSPKTHREKSETVGHGLCRQYRSTTCDVVEHLRKRSYNEQVWLLTTFNSTQQFCRPDFDCGADFGKNQAAVRQMRRRSGGA